MSGGSQNTVSQQTVPSWLQPYLTASLSQGAQDLQNPPQYYPGQQVASLTPLQQSGLSSIAGAASLPSASSGALGANQLETSGALLNPNANPYLQQEFNQGAQGIQNQIASEFAGSGSNVANSAGAQSAGMGTLAANLYGGAYGQGLQAMTQASALAPSIDQGLYMPGQQMYNAGTSQQQQQQNEINADISKWNFGQQTPENMLSWYSSLTNQNASPFIGSSNTQSQSPSMLQTGAGAGMAMLPLLMALA